MNTTANLAQHEAWNGDSGQRWVVDPDRRDRVMVTVADALLAAARLSPGEAVLDIGCGCGATTLLAARAVMPAGSVHGVDISAPMLGVARTRVEVAGLANVTLARADAQTWTLTPGAYDVAISRFGTMFFDDPAAAFANIRAAMRPHGRLCIATWQPLAANEWLMLPGAVLLRYGTMPEAAAGPGMFAQSDPDVVTDVLTRAHWGEVDVRPVTVRLRLGSDPAEATEHLADTGVGRAVIETIPEADRPRALAAVTEMLADHVADDGVGLDAAIWITTATA